MSAVRRAGASLTRRGITGEAGHAAAEVKWDQWACGSPTRDVMREFGVTGYAGPGSYSLAPQGRRIRATVGMSDTQPYLREDSRWA